MQLLEENGYPVSKCRILRFGRKPSEGFQEAIWRKEELMDHWRIFKHYWGFINSKEDRASYEYLSKLIEVRKTVPYLQKEAKGFQYNSSQAAKCYPL